MEKEQIIVDIEWDLNSKILEPNVLQLGAVKVNESNEIIDSYYSIIKPEKDIVDIDVIVNFMPISEEQLMNGKNKSQVINEFMDWCGKDALFIVWGSTNCQVFKEFMDGNLEVSKNNTLDLQMIYKIIKVEPHPVSLGKACSESVVKEIYPLHNSLNDSITLAALYSKFQKSDIELAKTEYLIDKNERKRIENSRYKKRCVTEKIIQKPSNHFFIIEGTNIIHRRNCSCLNNVTTTIKGFSGLKGLMGRDKRLCPECFHGYNSFPNSLSESEAIHIIELHAICSNYGLSSESYGDTLIINTKAGSWYFELAKNS